MINHVDVINPSVLNRWLDRAAVEGRVCTVEQVEELKSLLTMLPLWSTFLVYGLILATGNTFFYQQTDYTANYLGQISAFSYQQSNYWCNELDHISNKVPATIFVIIRYSVVFVVSRLCDLLLSLHWGDNIPRRVMLVRSGVGLAVSPICCLVAWRIEEYRVHQRLNHAICIRFSWLIPQFVLLGLMEGLVLNAMQNIYASVVPQSLQRYGPPFTLFALNIGHFISLLFIFIFRNLFNDDLDFSRLGVYYKNLGYVCFVNLVIYCCVATYYAKQESSDAGEVIEQPLEQMHNLQEEGPSTVGVVGEQQDG